MTDIGQRIVELATLYSGCGATTRRDEFETLLGPTIGKWDLDRPFKIVTVKPGVIRTQGISACGLVAEGLWREAGIEVPEHWAVYAPKAAKERAIARARTLAGQHRAVRFPGAGHRPSLGDYLCVVNAGGSEHVCTVVGWEQSSSVTWCITVDGGQVDPVKGLQCIKTCKRMWRDKPTMLGDRRVAWWCNVESLPTATASV